MTNVGTSSLMLEGCAAQGLMSAGWHSLIASQSTGPALDGEGRGHNEMQDATKGPTRKEEGCMSWWWVSKLGLSSPSKC